MNRRFYDKKAVILLIAFVMCLPTFVVPISVNAEAAQPVGSYLAERWSNSIEGGVAAKPVIAADGTLYILSEKGKLYAFNPAGKQLWTAEVRSMSGETYEQEGQLELGADGVVYVGSSGNLYAFQADGVKKWEYETSYPRFQKIAVQRNGLIYILLSNSSEHMIVLRSDGKLASERKDVSALVEYQGLTEDKVYIVSTKRSVKTIGGKLIFESVCYAEELNQDGSVRWKFNLNSSFYNTSTDEKGNLLVFTEPFVQEEPSSPFYNDGSRKPTEVKVIGDGLMKRSYSLTGRTFAPLLFDDQQNVFIVTKDAAISKYDSQGKLLWRLPINEEANVLENGTAMHLDEDGSLLFYSALSGYETSKDGKIQYSTPYKPQLLRISQEGKLISSSQREHYTPAVWLENGMLLSTGYNEIALSDSQMSHPVEYQTNDAFYYKYVDSNTIYVGTRDGRVSGLEIKEVSNKGEVVSISFGNVYPIFEPKRTYSLQAVVKWSDGKEQTNPKGIIYRSSNEKIAFFDATGFHTLGAGKVELTAEYLQLKATIKVEVSGQQKPDQSSVTYNAKAVKKWGYALPGLENNKTAIYQAPLISEDGTVYATSRQGKLTAISAAGELLWQQDMKQLVLAKPVIGPDGRLYIGTENGQLTSFDPLSGKELLNSTAAANYHSTMLGWDRSGTRYTGFTNNISTRTGSVTSAVSQLQAIDKAGAVLWTVSLNGEITHSESVLNGVEDTLYVVTTRSERIGGETTMIPGVLYSTRSLGTLHAIDASSGSVRWKHELGSSDSRFYKPKLLQDGTIVAASSEGTINAVDTNGQLKWKKNLKAFTYAEPFLSNEKLVIFQSGTTEGMTEGEAPFRFMNLKASPKFINQRENEWLLTLSDNSFANSSRHSVASYDTAGKLLWQIPLVGDKTTASGITNDLHVAVIDAASELSLYEIRVTRSDESVFFDMKKHWAKTAVEELAEAGVVTGFADGTYRPDTQVTREQFLAMLSKKLKTPQKAAHLSYTDVSKTRWSRAVIESALANGWIDGKSYGNQFKPAQPVTREEVAVWTAKALKLPEKANALVKVTDRSSIQASNLGLVGAVIDSGIIKGYKDGSFKPKDTLTRAEAASLLFRIKS